MPPRRRLLLAMAGMIGIVDAVSFWWSQRHISYAPIIYVGVDSLMVSVAESRRGATLRNGRWDPALSDAQIFAGDMMGTKRPLTLVTLTPSAPIDNFIQSVKSLRAQGKCNVLIRGSEEESAPSTPTNGGPRNQYIQALVLCGSSIGDAGFSGRLPPDGIVRIAN